MYKRHVRIYWWHYRNIYVFKCLSVIIGCERRPRYITINYQDNGRFTLEKIKTPCVNIEIYDPSFGL